MSLEALHELRCYKPNHWHSNRSHRLHGDPGVVSLNMPAPLAINGLQMPADFPATPFERVHARLRPRASTHAILYEHFIGAWNALSIRYLTLVEEGDAFTASIGRGNGGDGQDRYRQERHLFGFFGSGFSAFESYFYGMYAIGAVIQPAQFSLATPKDQQLVSPSSTDRLYKQAFAGDPILGAFQAAFTDAAYREWKEIRNILTHRTAPGRTIFVSIESDEELTAQWKINNIPLDAQTASSRRGHASRLLLLLLEAAAVFAEARIV